VLAAAVVESGQQGAASRAAGRATFEWPRPTGGGRTAKWRHQHRLCWAQRKRTTARRSEACRPVSGGPWSALRSSRPWSWHPRCGRPGWGELLTRMTAAVVPRMGRPSQRRGGSWGELAPDVPW
jgi:hypothetical protein